jgi:hypothetical protein
MNKMSKSEVYSWRLTPALKAELEAAARAEKLRCPPFWSVSCSIGLRSGGLGRRSRAGAHARRINGVRRYVQGAGVSATNERVAQVMGEQLDEKWRASQRRASRRSDDCRPDATCSSWSETKVVVDRWLPLHYM